MPGRSQPPAVAVLRAAASARVAVDGFRATAREVGIRPSVLQYFLSGGNPHTATLRKLADWYFRTAPAGGPRGPMAYVVAAEMLVRDLPEPRRAEAFARLTVFLSRMYQGYGAARPGWLEDVINPPTDDTPEKPS